MKVSGRDTQAESQPPVRRTAVSTLRHRDFRLLWLGQLISTIGDQMQAVAISWQIFVLTDSPLHVGLVGVSRSLPFMLLSFIGGLVIGFAGLATTYGINAVSFLGVIAALILMSSVPEVKRGTTRGWNAVLGGLHYARSEPLVLTPLALDFVVTCLRAFRSLLPVFARDVLAFGPAGLGLLHMATAAGALVGAGVLGIIGGIKRRVVWMLATYALQGLFLIGFGLSRFFAASLVMLFGYGIGDVTSEVMRVTIVQLKTPDELRGRVSALSSMFTQGGPQLGQLQMGAVATLFGPTVAALNGGALVLLAVGGFSFLPPLRRAMKAKE